MKQTILAVAVSALSTAVFAQSNNTENTKALLPTLETMVVVSSRQQQPLREVATSIAVLDEAQIKARGFTALADVLRSMPSVSVTNTGGMGKPTSIRVRGESGYRTMVRVDGVDVTDPTGTQAGAQLQHIMSADVSRVELLRGPQGLMYGADSGGVLNISTTTASDETQVKLAAEGGSYDSQRYNASVGGANETLDYFVGASYAETEGFNASLADAALRDDDGYENTTLHGRVGWNVSGALRLEAVLRDTDASNEFDRCSWPYQDDCIGDFEQTNTRVSAKYHTERLNNELAYSNTDVARQNIAAGAVSYDTEGEIQKLEWLGRAKLSDTHTFAYGLEQRADKVLELSRDQWAAYAEYQGHYGHGLYVTAGVRRDDSDDFGDYNTFRMSGAYVLDLNAGSLKVKSSYGTGFRAPSLFEIDYNRQQNNPELAPLTPEESEGWDAGIEYFGNSGLHLELVYFDQGIDREIDWDGGYVQSAGESTSEGFEFIADFPMADWLVINANYSYTDAKTAEGSVRARQPENMANVGFTFVPAGALQASVNVRTADGTQDRYGDPIASYQVLDASVRYTLSSAVSFYVRGENLTDEEYVEVPNYRTAGASGYAGLDVTF
ncbi:TonB-dependent receptor [Gilvimarinus sp. SDUM040013]|uniref:TonB-dependent receptor n=1 Tax=Gilvimarinus gilvus TaxID=3058038 RepID=A0ABU4RYZ6_9GAMM|nr:TonB-dependent receptor [Gilvimarinus sp. SDUM040013]MDO3384577.1 TonB-dependent receptor [Gilvimarinus sp. SDUM040013]MDX6850087.1 TonB-dependent receptor [Gilvimarinus sp. SDUM040013]